MRRITMLFTVAAMMAVLLSISAGPASARVIFHDNDNDGRQFGSKDNGLFIVSNDNDWWDDDDDDFDFFGNRGFDFDRDGEVSLGLGDTENESGEIGTENSFSVSGDNNSTCLGQLQFGQTGNFTNQQGALQYASEGGPSLSGPSASFSPSNGTSCDQAVEQAAAASSTF